MTDRGRQWVLVGWMALLGWWAGGEMAQAAQAVPQGQLTWAIHFTIAPTYFEPAEHQGIITPMLFYYALHDALVKPMPGNIMAPSLAESWTESPDGLVYEFQLRQGVRFHNGAPLTADDVVFSFERYKGAAANELKTRVKLSRPSIPIRSGSTCTNHGPTSWRPMPRLPRGPPGSSPGRISRRSGPMDSSSIPSVPGRIST